MIVDHIVLSMYSYYSYCIFIVVRMATREATKRMFNSVSLKQPRDFLASQVSAVCSK